MRIQPPEMGRRKPFDIVRLSILLLFLGVVLSNLRTDGSELIEHCRGFLEAGPTGPISVAQFTANIGASVLFVWEAVSAAVHRISSCMALLQAILGVRTR